MASCYGDESGGENKECSGLLGQELVKQVLPIEWKIERQDNYIWNKGLMGAVDVYIKYFCRHGVKCLCISTDWPALV